MATAKKNTPTTDRIAEAEQALADARNLLTLRKADAEQAAEDAADIKDRLGWGDDTVTADDMIRGQFNVDRAAGLIKAAERDIAKAEKNLREVVAKHDPILAGWVADAIKANPWGWGLYGIPVSVGEPGPDAPAPSVWLSQVPAAERKDSRARMAALNPTGRVSGIVNLRVVTPDGEEMRDAAAIFNAARKLAQSVDGEVNPHYSLGSHVQLSFSNVTPGLLVLPAVTRQPTAAHGALLSAIVKGGGTVMKPAGSVGRLQSFNRITGEVVQVQEVDTVQDGRVILRSIDGVITLRDVTRELIEKAAEQIIGTDALGAGRVELVDIQGYEVREVRPEYTGRTDAGQYRPDTTEATVRVRIVVRFRLAR